MECLWLSGLAEVSLTQMDPALLGMLSSARSAATLQQFRKIPVQEYTQQHEVTVWVSDHTVQMCFVQALHVWLCLAVECIISG